MKEACHSRTVGHCGRAEYRPGQRARDGCFRYIADWHGALPMTAAACRRRWVLAHKSIRASPRRPLVLALTDQIAAGSYSAGEPGPVVFPSRGRRSNSKPDRSAPIVRVEIYIRRRFLTLALHHFDGWHPRRGAWGLCQQRGTSQDDGQSGESCESFHCDPHAGSWHREALTRATIAV